MSFSITVYRNSRSAPDPETYLALRSVSPVSSSRVGVPPVVSTVTGPSNVTVTLIKEPIPYVAPASGEETETTVGRTPSTTSVSPGAESRPSLPGAGNVTLALLPAASRIVPALRSMVAAVL